MEVLMLAADYFVWHYTKALEDFFDASTNLLWLVHRSFSVPAKRVNQHFAKWPARIGSIVGCFLIIFAGFIVLVLTLCLEALALLLWLFLPLILLVLFVFAVLCLISAAS